MKLELQEMLEFSKQALELPTTEESASHRQDILTWRAVYSTQFLPSTEYAPLTLSEVSSFWEAAIQGGIEGTFALEYLVRNIHHFNDRKVGRNLIESYSKTACGHHEHSQNFKLSELSHFILDTVLEAQLAQHRRLLWACAVSASMESLLKAYSSALSWSITHQTPAYTTSLRCCWGIMEYMHVGTGSRSVIPGEHASLREKLATQMESGLQSNDLFADSFSNDILRPQVLQCFAELCYACAVQAENDGQDPSAWISRLTKIRTQAYGALPANGSSDGSTKKPAQQSSGLDFDRQYPVLLTGRWYREHGDLSEAKACLWPILCAIMDILEDDVHYNDDDAFTALAEFLMHGGDIRGSEAATRLLLTRRFPTDDEKPQLVSLSPAIRNECYEAIVAYTCDSCCGSLKYVEGFNVCTGAYIGLRLCDKCLRLLKDGQMPLGRVPSEARNNFYRACDHGLPDVPFGKVRFGGVDGQEGEMMDLKVWYSQLKAYWRPA